MEPTRKLLAFALALETSLAVWPFRAVHADQGAAAAAAPRASLHWVRDASAQGCVDGRELARRVESKLRRPVFEAPRDAELIVEGTATRKGEGYRAELRTFDGEGKALGSREVLSERPTCDELSETVAVVLAVMIDPAGALNPPPLAPTPEQPPPSAPTALPPPSPPVVAPCPAPVPTPPVAQPPASPAPEVSVFARAAYGYVPEFMWGGGIAFELGFRRWGGLRVEGVAMAERAIDERSGPTGTGVDVRVFYASAAYCPLWLERGRYRVAACAGVAVGALQSQGFGFKQAAHDAVSPLVDGVLDSHGNVRLWKGLGLNAGAGLSVPFARTTFTGTQEDGSSVELFAQPQVGGRFDLGIGTQF